MTDKAKKEIADHLESQTRALVEDLEDVPQEDLMVASPPPPPDLPGPEGGSGVAGDVGRAAGAVVGGVGNIVGGVASTGADVVAGVGNVADALHDEINSFFSNLRRRLGI